MRKIISFLLIFASLFCLLTSCDSNDKPNYYHTEDVADFNTGVYTLDEIDEFYCGLPDNSELISYYYHVENYNSEYNVFLEIKCSSEYSLVSYIERVKVESVKYWEDKYTNHACNYYEEQNPYDSSFTDLFLPRSSWITGYENTYRPAQELTRAHYFLQTYLTCISYSRENLTVLISYAYQFASSRDNSSYAIPRYLVYFNVPLDKEYQRFFVTSRPK